MDRFVTVKICAPETIPPGYPMSGRTFEDFVVQGFRDGKKAFGGVSHSALGAAGWIVDFFERKEA